MLRKIRVLLALISFTVLSFFFVDFADIAPSWLEVFPKLQFIPAILSLNLAVLALLIVLTLLFGRIYCSILCPLGIFQDAVAWVTRRLSKRRDRQKFHPSKPWLRWAIFFTVVIAFMSGFPLGNGLLALVDPYSIYGRMAAQLIRPIYLTGNNLLAWLCSTLGSSRFYFMDISLRSVLSLGVALSMMALIALLAAWRGRLWCNVICPVGTLFGFASKFALFKPRIDASRCTVCGVCARQCKAECIDLGHPSNSSRSIDASRCVSCFDCLARCPRQAITWTPPRVFTRKDLTVAKPITSLTRPDGQTPLEERPDDDQKQEAGNATIDVARRQLLISIAALAAVGPTFSDMNEDKEKHVPPRDRPTPITPPGSENVQKFLKKCTACQLCISHCPGQTLRPAHLEHGLKGILTPVMDFEKGFCSFECTNCSQTCPTGALTPLSREEKQRTQVGHAIFEPSRCVVNTDGTYCGACSEHCPTQAVHMVPFRDGLTLPQVDPSRCIGCGACEYICPVRPKRAIHVEGKTTHQRAYPPEIEARAEIEIEDFGF